MKVGIICAGDREFEPYLSIIENPQITKKAMLIFYEGTIQDVNVVALYCGVCKVNAAIATQILIDTYGVNLVINTGAAGGINPELELLDTVICTEVAYHDVSSDILTEFHPWMETVYFNTDKKLLDLSKKVISNLNMNDKVYWGRMVTGETFIEDDGRQKIIDEFAPLSVDMETASIAHVCYVNNIPFISIRSITDTASHSGSDNFEKNCAEASVITKNIAVELLKEIKDTM